jgi:hypothetical protein
MPLMVKIRLALLCVVAVAVVAGIVAVFVFLNAGAAEAKKREEAACAPIREKAQQQAVKAQVAAALFASGSSDGLWKSRAATTTKYTLVSDNFECFDDATVHYARDVLDVIESDDDAQLRYWNCSYDGETLRIQRIPVASGSDRRCTWYQLWQAGAYS